jgi:hypothetical protein
MSLCTSTTACDCKLHRDNLLPTLSLLQTIWAPELRHAFVVDHRQNVSAANHVLSCLPATEGQVSHSQHRGLSAGTAGTRDTSDKNKEQEGDNAVGLSPALAKL